MKKFFVIFMTLLATNNLFSQSNKFFVVPNSDNTAIIWGVTGIYEGQTCILGGPKSRNGSFFTIDKGVQTKVQLGDNATMVLFGFNEIDDKLTIQSGTESVNAIVKTQSSKTTFNDSETTSIEIHVGDVFTAYNTTLRCITCFRVESYDAENDDLTLVITSTGLEFISFDNICVIPDHIDYNNEKYTVTEIAPNGFNGFSNLTSVTIPSTITKVGENAFSGCTKLTKVTCLSTTPPEAYSNSFENYNGYLYIPCDNFDDYDVDACWGTFRHKECIGSETVELTKDEVKVEPEKTEAVFSMPINESANSYTLTIQNNGVTFCTLTFNAQGQLANIDFSTTKSYELKADVAGFKFTVTGLSTASDYGYSFKALASNKSVLKEYSGSFTTKNADGTGGSVQGGGEGTLAVDAVSNATAVTVVNAQILVNGEAPAFVYTISGKKIANQNLRTGVYLVNVEGETVKVVK